MWLYKKTKPMKRSKWMNKTGIRIAVLSCLFGVIPAEAANVELVVTYDSGAESFMAQSGGSIIAAIEAYRTSTNTIFARQKIPITLVINKIAKKDFPSKEIGDSLLAQTASGNGVLRSAYRADYAVHFSKSSSGRCGQAYIRTNEKSTSNYNSYFSTSAINCGNLTFAHELGHNFGLRHSKKQDGKGGVYPYGLGYAVEKRFATIMVHNYIYEVFGGGAILPFFSDPDYYHPAYGYLGDANANARLALQNITPYISKGENCISYNGSCQTGTISVSAQYQDQDYSNMSYGNSQKVVALPLVNSGNDIYTGVINKDSTYPLTNRSISISLNATLYSLSTTYGPPTVGLRSCTLAAAPDKAYKVTFDIKSDRCTATAM